jgi:ABC-type transport system involved in cytochrome bd biosynthesis fused ATPase/permease subunit
MQVYLAWLPANETTAQCLRRGGVICAVVDADGAPVRAPVFAPPSARGLNFGLDLESRAAIVGPNGIGKSTLLGLIAGGRPGGRGGGIMRG